MEYLKSKEKHGNNNSDKLKNMEINNTFLTFLGTLLYSLLFYYCAYNDFSLVFAYIFLCGFNIICCLYFNKVNYNITVIELIKSFCIIFFLSFILQLVCTEIFPFPKRVGMFSGLDALIVLFAPSGVMCLFPQIIYKILYILNLRKLYNILSIAVFALFLLGAVYNYIGIKPYTNFIEKNDTFGFIKINYDYKNDSLKFSEDGELIKYYRKYSYNLDDFVLFFVLNPGIYEISTKNFDFSLLGDNFCKINRITKKRNCNYKVAEIKNDNILFTYDLDDSLNNVVEPVEIKKNENGYITKRFILNDVYILEIYPSILDWEITIKKINGSDYVF